MVEERIEPTLTDPRKEDNIKFANMLDPIRWAKLIKDFQNTDDKRSLEEMLEELISGR